MIAVPCLWVIKKGVGFLKCIFDEAFKNKESKARKALSEAAVSLRSDLTSSGALPFESGHLQNSATYVDVGRLRQNSAAVVVDTVYARRKFFHPEFTFDQTVNKRAGGRWFDEYVGGAKKDFIFDEFAMSMKGRIK